MLRSLKFALAFSSALLVGSFIGAKSYAPHAYASERPPPPDDPKKKKAGDECKSSDECQSHHSCAKVGDKNVCQAPRSRLPPGAVT
jgi:hypothetical protein